MTLFLTGLFLFIAAHLLLVFTPAFKASIIKKTNPFFFKSIFSLLILTSLTMIIIGWPNANSSFLYDFGVAPKHILLTLMPIAFILVIASLIPNHINHFIKNPLLTGVKLWALGHLLANGEIRSVILFSTFLFWAVLMVIGLKKRKQNAIKDTKDLNIEDPNAEDLVAQPTENRPASLLKTALVILIGLISFAAFVHMHEYLIGVNPFS